MVLSKRCASLGLPVWIALLALCSNWQLATSYGNAVAFSLSKVNAVGKASVLAPKSTTTSNYLLWRSTQHRNLSTLFESSNDEDESIEQSPPATPLSSDTDNSLLQRFLSPKIDDLGLPLTDVLLAQIVAPTFQIYWLLLNHAPNPSWLQPISSYFGEAPELAPRGSLLAPTLIHGAGLAVCWLAGALAAKSFEREAFTLKGVDINSDSMDVEESKPIGLLESRIKSSLGGRGLKPGAGRLPFFIFRTKTLLELGGRNNKRRACYFFSAPQTREDPESIGRYDTILIRLVQAGAFASGILILSTQLDLLLEFGRYIQYGESDETDLRLLVATVEVINDIFFEALVISSWRIIHANFMSTPTNRLRRF